VDDAPLIDWESRESHVLLNPRMPADERNRVSSWASDLPAHLWLGTSGTTGSMKLVALSKEAMLASAAAVNRRLEASSHDVWYSVLPWWHVGGLGIEGRAFLSQATVVRSSWDARAFAAHREMTLSSLVPAQVSDLVTAGLHAPPQLRAVVVGGGVLHADLYRAAVALGWPLLPSYGMTESCSQVATALPGNPDLRLLDHVEAREEPDGRLAFRGGSMLTAYATSEGVADPKIDGWLVTEDVGSLDGDVLRVSGRGEDWVKVGGESVALPRLDAVLEILAGTKAAVLAVPDARLGNVIWLAVEPGVDVELLRTRFDAQVHPFERARRLVPVRRIPRTDLGKLQRKRLLEVVLATLE
jgi:o-succinylbenzoate---CoA ligase